MAVKPYIYNPPKEPWLDLLYEDAHLLAFNKQSGLLSVPGKTPDLADCLESRARSAYPEVLQVHRLDRGTSGIFLMARTPEAQRFLQRGFERRLTSKTYIAEVVGCVTDDGGTIDLPLITDWPNRPMQMVDHERGKPALTHWSVLGREKDRTRLELKPVTGRSHQLRVHMQAIGHPIVGDEFYADEAGSGLSDRLHLHAAQLSFPHPEDGEVMTLTSDCPF